MTAVSDGRPARVTGLDVARALALFGMFAAHIANAGMYGPGGWRWLVATHGRSSALFAVLAGVSIALMLTRSSAADPVRHTRVRVAVRAVLLIFLGWALEALGTPVDVILDNLGVMFLLVLVAFRWRPWVLLGLGAVILCVGRDVLQPLVDHLPTWFYDLPVIHELWGIHYPALIWVGYVLIGMGLGKLAPWRGQALGWLAASGLLLAVLAYGTGAWTLAANGEPIVWGDSWGESDAWYQIAAHSYTAFEMLGNVGVACAVIALCCFVARVLPRVTWPLAAAGSMTLTLYTAHIVMIAIAGAGIVFEPTNAAWLALCAACLLFASVWRWRVGQGPLEGVFTSASTALANIDAVWRARVSGPV
ncbi:heparan-alpha-glucosaminide N-acetyltransferase domain-containing protein [Demequina sp.]|uniref:heparan-alpha-glucosaminide N-acetyltransferase domain-containing protein n=1 Tax=Demequina sp. TaxID=2050685 RepID=UPI003D0B667A